MTETPEFAVKLCCKLGKTEYLAAILEAELGEGTEGERALFDEVTNSTHSDLLSDPLSIAITASHKDIVTLILDQTPVDILAIDAETENTYIHLACWKTEEIYILESLLIKLRSVLKKEEIEAFLERKNKDGEAAIEFCSSKAKNGMSVILGGFV